MMTKHSASGGLSAEIKQDRELYREALSHMEEARQHCRPEGRDYIDCFVGRLRFAIHYLDAADAFGATASAEKTGNLDEARRQANIAVESIRAALESYAEIVRDHGDLGALALMNKYCYRPIRDKRDELER